MRTSNRGLRAFVLLVVLAFTMGLQAQSDPVCSMEDYDLGDDLIAHCVQYFVWHSGLQEWVEASEPVWDYGEN